MKGQSDEAEDMSAFEPVSDADSKSLFKPSIVALVVSNSKKTGPNVMTAGWWMAAGHDPFRYVVAINDHTYTHEIIQKNPEFVLAVPSTDMIGVLTVCGSASGRDINKIDHLGLKTAPATGINVPLLENAAGNVECKVVETVEFEDTTYYFGDVVNAYVQPGGLDGRILSSETNPLAYMGSDWAGDNDSEKHRYYLTFEEDDIEGFPGSTVLKDLPTGGEE